MTKVAMETVDAVRRRLDVEVPESDVRAEIERAYEVLRRKAKVRGFRPGHAPRAVLERLFGDQVRADAFGKLIQQSYQEAVRQQQLTPVGQPEIITESAPPSGPLRYSVTLEVKPEVLASGYSGLAAERAVKVVSDAEVEQLLSGLQESLAQLRPVTDRITARAGDIATVDYEAHAEGRLIGRGEGRLVEVGGGATPGGLGAHLEGADVGSEVGFEVDYPPDDPNPDLAGRRVSFHAVIRALALKELPPLDDEFAKDHGECETLEELRARARQQLEAAGAREADGAVRAALVEQLLQAHEIEVPRAMVERRTEALVDDVMDHLGPRRPPASREGEFRAKLREELATRARNQVRAALVLEAIARQEHLTVGDEEVDVQIGRLAERAGNARERVRALYQEPAARENLRMQMLQERALDLVVEQAHIRTVDRTSSVADGGRNG